MEDRERRTPDASRSPVPVRIEEALAAACMALICLISLGNVVVRYLTNASFAFTEEFSVFLLVAMTLLGASVAFARGEHIRIAIVTDRLPRPLRRLCDLLVLAVTTAMFSLVIWYGALFALDQWQYDETSAGLGYPTWIYTIWLPLLCGVIILRVVERAWRDLRRGGGS